MDKIRSNYYEKYVGCYAKRFYTPFEKQNMFKILCFRIRLNIAEIRVIDMGTGDNWWWDVEDCVFITDEKPMIEDERVANIFHPEYKGYNPFTKNNGA